MLQTGDMGRIYLRELRDYMRAKVSLKIRCKHCGHTAVLSSHDIFWEVKGKHHGVQSLYKLRRALRCSRCGEKWVDLKTQPSRD